MILFADINDDGLEDMLFAEAGSDAPPWQVRPSASGLISATGHIGICSRRSLRTSRPQGPMRLPLGMSSATAILRLFFRTRTMDRTRRCSAGMGTALTRPVTGFRYRFGETLHR